MANGAAGESGWARSCAVSASVISASHSSSCDAGRALSAGIAPTTPALHWAMTSFGLLMMNSGEPMTGNLRLLRTGGKVRAGAVMKFLGVFSNAMWRGAGGRKSRGSGGLGEIDATV